MIGPQAPSSSFESLIKEMNFKGDPKTLRNVKSRFKQFKRYIDQGENYKYQENQKKSHFSDKNDEDWYLSEHDKPQSIHGGNSGAGRSEYNLVLW